MVAFDQLRDGFDDDTLPYMTPYWRFDMDGQLPFGLGDFDVFANTVNLRREQGDDYSRVSLGASWSRPVIAPGGVRFAPFATGRADAFGQTEAIAGAPDVSRNFTRVRGAAGLDVSYPFVRPGERFDVVIAPRTALVASNGGDPDEQPVIQDVVSVDFDRSLLFQPVRAPGFDVFEDGVRLDAGLELDVSDQLDVFGLEAFVGRSYRLDGGDERFDPASGLFEDQSDWIADVRMDLGPLYAGASTRIDTETGGINRLAAEAGVSAWRVDAQVEYLDLSDEASSAERGEVRWKTELRLTESLTAFYDGRYDTVRDEDRTQEAGLIYRDECTLLRVYWERSNIRVGNLGPSNSVKFEVVLFTLGGVAEE